MTHRFRVPGILVGLMLLAFGTVASVAAQGPPDLTKFGYPTVAASMDVTPDQMATITAGDQSVLIRPGTFDVPVTFALLTSDPATWKDTVRDRTVRAAFAFRVTDKASGALIGMFKQPVVYTYSGRDAQSSDAILNTTAASPPVVTPNPAPATFADGKLSHPFAGAGVGWLVVSTATGTPAAASSAGAGTATVSATRAIATGTGGGAVSATTAPTTARTATTAATATASATRPAATGTGGGTIATTTAPTTLPQTGAPGATAPLANFLRSVGAISVILIAGGFILRRTRHAAR